MAHHINMVHGLILHKMDKGDLNFESKEALKRVLDEYEIHIKTIEQQLDLCKKDHEELRIEISHLVEENKDLYEKLMSRHRQQQSPTTKSDKNGPFHHSEMVDNLQQQLALALEEKRTVEAMWKASLREVDTLQEQVQQYQSGHQLTLAHNKLSDLQKDYSEAIKLLESKLVSLKAENNQLTVKTQLLEDQLMQVTSQMALMTEKNLSLSNALKESRNREQELKSGYLTLEAKYIELDKSYEIDRRKFAHAYEHDKVEAQLQDKVEAAVRQRDELQAALERCQDRMAELLRNAASDRSRVEEAVTLAESVVHYRDETIAQQNALTEEIKRLKAELERASGEAERRTGQEASTMRRQYDLELAALRDQLRVTQQECNRKYAEVSQLQRECERLQALVDQGRLPAGTDSYRHDQWLEQAYQELQRADTDCQQLQKENQSLRDSLIRLEERCKRNSKEKLKLRQLMAKLEQQSQLYQHELAITSQRAELLASQLDHTNLELAQLQSETILHRDNAANVQARVSVANTLELYKQLDESYGHMNDMWKNEMKTFTDKFEAKIKKIKSKTKNVVQEEDKVKIGDIKSKHR